MTARVAGLDAGPVDYIGKPFEQAELLARVRAALRTKAVRDGLVEQATRDGLTCLLNRGEIDLNAEAAIRLAERRGRALSILMRPRRRGLEGCRPGAMWDAMRQRLKGLSWKRRRRPHNDRSGRRRRGP